jgi:hypothetical protein
MYALKACCFELERITCALFNYDVSTSFHVALSAIMIIE